MKRNNPLGLDAPPSPRTEKFPRLPTNPIDFMEYLRREAVAEEMSLARDFPEEARVRAETDRQRARKLAQRALSSEEAAERAAVGRGPRAMSGDAFMLDLPDAAPALWGAGEQVLWMQDEALLLVGGDGVGKTTVAQQVVLGQIGLREQVLGLPVAPADGLVVYLAMDRPEQIRRSFARMVTESDRAVLRERFRAWKGPLPISPTESPDALAVWLRTQFGSEIGAVVVDSYKDLVPGLSDDEPGTRLNLAMQEVLAQGVQWLGLHHPRKPSADRSAEYTLHDVYGSRWLTAGAGSVVMLLGDAGADIVEARHVKQPRGVVGPIIVQHDHRAGRSERVRSTVTVTEALHESGDDGLTVDEIAAKVYPGQDDAKFRKRIERELARLEKDERARKVTPAKRGGEGGTSPNRWFAC